MTPVTRIPFGLRSGWAFQTARTAKHPWPALRGGVRAGARAGQLMEGPLEADGRAADARDVEGALSPTLVDEASFHLGVVARLTEGRVDPSPPTRRCADRGGSGRLCSYTR